MIFFVGAAVDSLAAADVFGFDRMRCKDLQLRDTRRERPSLTSILSDKFLTHISVRDYEETII